MEELTRCQTGTPAGRACRDTVVGLTVGFRIHDLRHYFASLLIAEGLDIKTLQALLRHASAKTRWTPTAICGQTKTGPPEPRSRRS